MEKKIIFISFPFEGAHIATYIAHQIYKNKPDDVGISIYPYNVDGEKHWLKQIKETIEKCNYFIFIVGDEINQGQKEELKAAIIHSKPIWLIETKSGQNTFNETLEFLNIKINTLKLTYFNKWDKNKEIDIEGTIENILKNENISWKHLEYFNDGLPLDNQIFNYEKKIIEFYYNYDNFKIPIDSNHLNEQDYTQLTKKILAGVPAKWPKVKSYSSRALLELIPLDKKVEDEIGKFRKIGDNILSAALTGFHNDINKCPCKNENQFNLVFPEARPSGSIFSTKTTAKFRIGVLVSGGIAPGINAVIDGITRRHYYYAKQNSNSIEILGLKDGFHSLKKGGSITYNKLYPVDTPLIAKDGIVTSHITNEGGSIIGTSRFEDLVEKEYSVRVTALKNIVNRLRDEGIRILYIIGGEGSMKAALALQKIANTKRTQGWDLSVVGIPKTMDNDILWVWQTFGFMSAVDKAREFIEYMHVEAKSNPRWGIVQLFGSNSGFVVSHAVLACKSDICDIALIPEMTYKLKSLIKFIKNKNKENGLIVLAETAVPDDISEYTKKKEIKEFLTIDELNAINSHGNLRDNINCHVDDDLRSGVVKIIYWAVKNEAEKEVVINEPRHLIRSIPPSTIDIINASRLGALAVDNAMAGFYGFMISQWLTEFCLIPLELVVLGRKRIPPEGIFFKSVLNKTGQPELLYD